MSKCDHLVLASLRKEPEQLKKQGMHSPGPSISPSTVQKASSGSALWHNGTTGSATTDSMYELHAIKPPAVNCPPVLHLSLEIQDWV